MLMTQTIQDTLTEEHDRLDDLFEQFQEMKKEKPPRGESNLW